MQKDHSNYYIPHGSAWPMVATIGLTGIVLGTANYLHENIKGLYILVIGIIFLLSAIIGWFSNVISENNSGYYRSKKADKGFRLGMLWFIFSEIIFFGAFFLALFYARVITIPWLNGSNDGGFLTNLLIWPSFNQGWPLINTPDPNSFAAPKGIMETWGIPAINTLILLTSGLTITIAHWALLKNKRMKAIMAQTATALLGIGFLFLQFHEYSIAYSEKALKLSSGIFGSLFFMLTGFHGLHVTIGTISLIVILFRLIKNHFTPEHHFAFEAVAWYWHFVDVVWLILFVFVYWL